MTDEHYQEMRNQYVEFIKKLITDFGGLQPSITILGKEKDNGVNSVIHVPIPGKFIDTDEGKDKFVDDVVPSLAKHVSERFSVEAIAWASEAWLRAIDKKDVTEEILADWKSLPIKKEVLIIVIESENHNENFVMEIIRKGKQVDAHGELVDNIELNELSEYSNGKAGSGRFVGLYKKFMTHQKV